MNEASALDFLQRLFPGQANIQVPDIATVLGIHQQSARNQVSQKTFPIPTFRQGRFRYASIFDVASYLDSQRAQAK